MNNNDYKVMFAQVRSVHSANYDKLEVIMNSKKKHVFRGKPALVALSLILAAALSISAYAIVTNLMSPAEIARELGHEKLAAAFESGDGLVINESIISEGYIFTLHGVATGQNLTAFRQGIQADNTFIVLSIQQEDGSPMDYFNFETVVGDVYFAYCVVFDGFKPWQVSSRTLGGSGGQKFEQDGVLYVLLENTNLELLADHRAAFAVWDGFAPGSDTFQVNEDGSIAWAESMHSTPRAMFNLPLDPSKSDPARLAQILAEHGIAPDGSLLEEEDIPQANDIDITGDGQFQEDSSSREKERTRRYMESREEPIVWAEATE